jgi:hypothetical protein
MGCKRYGRVCDASRGDTLHIASSFLSTVSVYRIGSRKERETDNSIQMYCSYPYSHMLSYSEQTVNANRYAVLRFRSTLLYLVSSVRYLFIYLLLRVLLTNLTSWSSGWPSWFAFGRSRVSSWRLAVFTDVCHGFPQSSRQIPGSYLTSGHDRFLPHPFQYIIHASSFNLALWSELMKKRRWTSYK